MKTVIVGLLFSFSASADVFLIPCKSLAGVQGMCKQEANTAPIDAVTALPASDLPGIVKSDLSLKSGKVIVDPVKKAERIAAEKAVKDADASENDAFKAQCAKQEDDFQKMQCEMLSKLIEKVGK